MLFCIYIKKRCREAINNEDIWRTGVMLLVLKWVDLENRTAIVETVL